MGKRRFSEVVVFKKWRVRGWDSLLAALLEFKYQLSSRYVISYQTCIHF